MTQVHADSTDVAVWYVQKIWTNNSVGTQRVWRVSQHRYWRCSPNLQPLMGLCPVQPLKTTRAQISPVSQTNLEDHRPLERDRCVFSCDGNGISYGRDTEGPITLRPGRMRNGVVKSTTKTDDALRTKFHSLCMEKRVGKRNDQHSPRQGNSKAQILQSSNVR